MEHQITATIGHMAKSQHELAKILEANRHVAVRLSHVVYAIPDHSFRGLNEISNYSMEVIKNVTSYLNGIADLEEAVAENLTFVMKNLKEGDQEE